MSSEKTPAGGHTVRASSSSESSETQAQAEMKRANVKRLIESYYYQLTNGCGKTDCQNEFCASSRHFCLPNLDSNTAAAKALEFLQRKTPLCEGSNKSSKVPRDGAEQLAPQAGSRFAESVPSSSGGASGTTVVGTVTMKNRALEASASSSILSLPERGAVGGSVKNELHRLTTSATEPVFKSEKRIEPLTEKRLISVIEACEEESRLQLMACDGNSSNAWIKLKRLIGEVFYDPEVLMNSFLVEPERMTKELMHSREVDLDKDQDEGEVDGTDDDLERETPHDMEVDAASVDDIGYDIRHDYGADDDQLQESEVITLDLASLRRAYDRLFSIPDVPFQAALINAITYLARTLESDIRSFNNYVRRPNYINIYVLIMEISHLDRLEYLEQATPQFCKTIGQLPVELQAKLVRIWCTFGTERLSEIVQRLQQLITVRVVTNSAWTRSNLVNDDDGITSAAKVLKILYYASIVGGRMDSPEIIAAEQQLKDEANSNLQQLYQAGKEKTTPREDALGRALNVAINDCRKPLIDVSEFVNESLSEVIEMDKDYTNYRAADISPTSGSMTSSDVKFSFMLHSFLLTTAVKNMGMYYDNRIRMMSERRASIFHSIVHGGFSMPYLRLRIRRSHIIDDSLVNLEMIAMDNPQDLRKQLVVEFDGEQGIDEGGVSKEFFQLVVEEIFNPDIGMFLFSEETRTFWFNSTSFENDGQFMLIGIVLGLAIYNNIILDIHFPMVVYRKLMGKLGVFEDLLASHPVIGNSLKQLLEYEGDVVEAFAQPFSIGTHDVFGNTHIHHLKDNGDEILVTSENREEFVNLYTDFLLNKSIERQFKAFQRGFQMVTDESPLAMLFQPDEIELLVCGSKLFDFEALEKAADYDGGYKEDTPVIRYPMFWEVMNEMTEEQKRQLLQFTTGSDRVPIGGLSKLKLIIARNGPDSDRLPTSHTCFNVLLLPEYRTKEKLKERLLKAITYSKGFGML